MSLPDPQVGCHRTGFAKKCRTLVTKGICKRWYHIIGTDANTGAHVDQFDCIDNFTPKLLIENSQLQRQTGAAVESFRNVVVGQNDAIIMSMREAQRSAHLGLAQNRQPDLLEDCMSVSP